MRFLMTTVAAAAFTAMPSLAQTPSGETSESAGAAGEMAAGASQGALEQGLGEAGVTELADTEIYSATYEGQQALVIVTGSSSLEPGTAEFDVGPDLTEDPTAAQPEAPEGEAQETMSAIPDAPEDDVAPDDAEAGTGDGPEGAPEIAQDSGEAGVDTGVAEEGSATPGEALSAAGLTDAEPASGVRVLRTTAANRTAIIVVGAGLATGTAGQPGAEGAQD